MGYRKKDGTIVSDEWMDAIAEAAEADELPGTVVAVHTGAGRPKIYGDDEMETISFRLPKSRVQAIDLAIKGKGGTRSGFLRDAVDKALHSV